MRQTEKVLSSDEIKQAVTVDLVDISSVAYFASVLARILSKEDMFDAYSQELNLVKEITQTLTLWRNLHLLCGVGKDVLRLKIVFCLETDCQDASSYQEEAEKLYDKYLQCANLLEASLDKQFAALDRAVDRYIDSRGKEMWCDAREQWNRERGAEKSTISSDLLKATLCQSSFNVAFRAEGQSLAGRIRRLNSFQRLILKKDSFWGFLMKPGSWKEKRAEINRLNALLNTRDLSQFIEVLIQVVRDGKQSENNNVIRLARRRSYRFGFCSEVPSRTEQLIQDLWSDCKQVKGFRASL